MRRRLRMLAIFLLAGGALTLAVAFIAATFGDVSVAPGTQSQVFDGRVAWVVDVQRTRWAQRYTSERKTGLAWSAEQAAGAPDTPRQGDIQSAWASAAQDNQREWLELEYAESIEPVEIHIYESYNPGAVDKVTLFDADGVEVVGWQGKDPATMQPTVAVARLPLSARVRTQRARIHIDSPAVAGWNEIDAVGLVDAAGTVHWARRVRASSVYGTGVGTVTGSTIPTLPTWTGLSEPSQPFRDELIKSERRVVEGYGWPMVALKVERHDLTKVALPTRPIWRGLLFDAWLVAVLLALVRWAMTRPIYFFREASRARRGCCIQCGYDLQFNLAAGCPECGWRREDSATPASSSSPAP